MFTQPKPNVEGLRPKLVFSLSTMQTCEKEIERRREKDQGMDKTHDVLLMLMLHPYIHSLLQDKTRRVNGRATSGEIRSREWGKARISYAYDCSSNRSPFWHPGSVLKPCISHGRNQGCERPLPYLTTIWIRAHDHWFVANSAHGFQPGFPWWLLLREINWSCFESWWKSKWDLK